MSYQIESTNFDDLWPVITEILDDASKENSSQLLDYRLVSYPWCSHCETLLKCLWNILQSNPPQGAFDILLNMDRINKETSDVSAIIKFKKLANVFKKLPVLSLPIRINDFQLFQNEYDIALQTIWPKLRNVLATLPNLPPVDARASVIRTFLNDPNNSAALAAPIPSLDLGSLNLSVVPPELERLSGIHSLNLSNNPLAKVPDFNMPNLAELLLINIRLAKVPDFTRMQNLTLLSLSHNQLTEVPDFAHLPALAALYLSGNKLTEVPSFAHLPNLTLLNLSENKLDWVPDFILLKKLTVLRLNDNNLTEVPDFDLQNLIHLFLLDNKLTEIPDFTHMPNLRLLALSWNKLAQVPDFVHLLNLNSLALTHNELTEIPDFTHMEYLKMLGLDFNQLTKVPNFANMPNLTELHLDSNKLTEIPDFAHLTKLINLYLNENRLMVIPDAILQRFADCEFARLFTSQLTYQCQTPLASLYQSFLANKSSHEQIHAFDALDQKDKNLIFEMVWEAAGKPVTSDSQWGEHHAFDEMPRFRIAVQKAILKKLNSLSPEKNDQVYGEIHHLAGQPLTEDSQWGKHHAEEHPARLADALSRVN